MSAPDGSAGRLGMSVGRLEAFSDGVLAIVITLLILDIKVPQGAHGHLGAALAGQWPRISLTSPHSSLSGSSG